MRSSSRHSSRLQNRQWVVPENASVHGDPPFRGGVSTSRPRPRGLGTARRRRRWKASCLVTRDTLIRLHSFLRKPWRERLVRGASRHNRTRATHRVAPTFRPRRGGVGCPTWTGCPVVTSPWMPRQRCERHAVAAHGARGARSYQATAPSCAYLLPPAATRVAASLGGN
jgi:hypothetical protein